MLPCSVHRHVMPTGKPCTQTLSALRPCGYSVTGLRVAAPPWGRRRTRNYGREADQDDLWDAVCAATDAHVRSVERDDQIEGNTVIILALLLLGREAYFKATMNLEIDHNVYVLSCKLRRK